MSRNFNGVGQYGTGNLVVSGPPLTMLAWLKCTTTSGLQIPVDIRTLGGAGTTDGYRFELNRSAGSLGLYTFSNGGATASSLLSATTTWVANTWFLATAVFNSTTLRSIYLNGGGKASDTATVSYSVPTSGISVGVYFNQANFFFSGDMAHVVVLNAALSDEEVAEYYRSTLPSFLRAGQVLRWFPLWGYGSNESEWSASGNNLTLVGTPPAGTSDPPLALNMDVSGMDVAAAAAGKLFQPNPLTGLGVGGPFFSNPVG